MKKVLYVTTVSRTINAFLVPHIEMLLKEGYEVQCACSIDKPVNKGLLEKGVKIYGIPFSRNPLGLGNIKAFKELVNIQKRENFDIVHVHTPIASIYGRLLKLRFKHLKTIYTAHGYHFLKGGSKLGWIMYYPIEKIMAKLTDTTININSEDYEITKNKFGIESYDAMRKFAVSCKSYIPNVVFTVVDCIGKDAIEASEKICDDLGITLRVRPFE